MRRMKLLRRRKKRLRLRIDFNGREIIQEVRLVKDGEEKRLKKEKMEESKN